jgi:filamentous hemagglutinin family protein
MYIFDFPWLCRRLLMVLIIGTVCGPIPVQIRANPVGGTVAQGAATFSSSGSQFVIQTTSDKAAINWQSFNIGVGETTTFVQPSSSSIVWNQINDPNPSQILGNLNANGYVILQNQAGFYVGGQAAISTRGLLMTTAPIAVPNLSSGGAWQFNAPPPTARIVNYGQVTAAAGGSVFLIAHDIENHGSISAPSGDIGLYAGRQVLVSDRPDGHGLSAKVTLPEGSVDNSGKLIADAGTIAMHAQVVNQGGLLQANSVREVNGTIELVASDALNLGPNSVISARGDSQGTSPGGMVVLSSDNTFADTPTSTITVAGGASGGKDGLVEIFGQGTSLSTVQSRIDGLTASQFAAQDILLINPFDISLSLDATDTSSSSPNLNVNDLAAYSKILLFANDSINLNTLWSLPDSLDPKASLKLQAKNSINITDDGSGNINGIQAGRNWNLTLVAGTELTSADNLQDGMDRIFLQGLSFIQTQNGSIDLTAGNEVFVDDGTRAESQSPFDITAGVGNGITTAAGGSISVTARFGDVTTGANPLAYSYSRNAPYYSVSTVPAQLGGISTAAGGDVSISAGGNVTSFMPGRGNTSDAGSGAFGSEPGNVTITAGAGVFGHFVEANGVGVITAGQNVGGVDSRHGFALSLVAGSWNVSAPNGSIYLQEVRNPNGIFNGQGGAGSHLFDYDSQASLLLDAANSVEITGAGVPRGNLIAGQTAPPIILPPSLQITAGLGGVKLDNSVTLFPSASGELNISTPGSFIGTTLPDGSRPELLMSDSGGKQWISQYSFLDGDHAATPVELNNPNPAVISVGGSMNNLIVAANKLAQITVGGDMNNTAFSGQNLHASDATSINVAGKIYNRGLYTFTMLTTPIANVNALPGTAWDTIFNLLVDPKAITNPDPSQDPSKATTGSDLAGIASRVLLFPSGGSSHNPGFVYNPTTLRFGFAGRMSSLVRDALEGKLEILQIGEDGLPVVANGHFVTVPVTFVPSSVIEALYTQSQDVPTGANLAGYTIGGPGQFNVHAGSLDLGTTAGIQSLGATGNPSLSSLTTAGAAVDVKVDGDLTMFTSRIASLFGGDVTVNSGGSINLGSQDLFNSSSDAFGVYTTGHSGVSVTARGDINISGSRIASYNGGNISVESLEGNVNVGSGGTSYASVPIVRIDPKTGVPTRVSTFIYGSGIVTVSLTKDLQSPGGNDLPGNITVQTPKGDIVSSFAGILQLPLDGSLAPGATITLTAGTPGGHAGNIDLGNSGVIGGAISLTAEGNIKGLIISRQNSTINAAQNFSGTLLSAGTANVSAGGSVAGTIIGVGGVNASAGGGISAALLSQNVSVGGGQAQSTLGSSATATSASQSASQQASSDTREQLAQTSKGNDDETKRKKLGDRPVLTRRVGRVTIFLPPA